MQRLVCLVAVVAASVVFRAPTLAASNVEDPAWTKRSEQAKAIKLRSSSAGDLIDILGRPGWVITSEDKQFKGSVPTPRNLQLVFENGLCPLIKFDLELQDGAWRPIGKDSGCGACVASEKEHLQMKRHEAVQCDRKTPITKSPRPFCN